MLNFSQFAQRIGLRRKLLVFVPHPDDETVGCGGLINLARRADIDVDVIVTTDGGASHPATTDWPRARLVKTRRQELKAALQILGCETQPLFLDLPDAETERVDATKVQVAHSLASKFAASIAPDVVLTTWRREPHCDHRFTASLAQRVCCSLRLKLLEYMVWTPVTGEPEDMPLARETTSLLLDVSSAASTKECAIRCHRSQLGKLRKDGFDLTPHLAEMMLSYERYECARSLKPST